MHDYILIGLQQIRRAYPDPVKMLDLTVQLSDKRLHETQPPMPQYAEVERAANVLVNMAKRTPPTIGGIYQLIRDHWQAISRAAHIIRRWEEAKPDLTDIPEVGQDWFEQAKVSVPQHIRDEQLKAFKKVVESIEPTWKCVDCGREFTTGPHGDPPYGVRTRFEPRLNQNVIVGDVCEECMK